MGHLILLFSTPHKKTLYIQWSRSKIHKTNQPDACDVSGQQLTQSTAYGSESVSHTHAHGPVKDIPLVTEIRSSKTPGEDLTCHSARFLC